MKNIWNYFWVFNLTLLFIFFALYFFYAQGKSKNFEDKNDLAIRFLLTDYCLSTESRHTRHLNFPELIAPFQDLPGYHEHFPSSSFFQVQNKKALTQ